MNKTVKNILVRAGMLLGVTSFLLLVVIAKINRDENRVHRIRISVDEWNGNFFISKGQVLKLVQEKFDIKNKILSGKELGEIERTVSLIPQVKKANAFTDDKGDLNIKIEQRKPFARVYNLQGQSYYLDIDGVKFPTSNFFTAKVPVVTGSVTEVCDTTSKISTPELLKTYNVIRAINKNNVWQAMIGQYNVNEKGQVEMIPRFGSSTVLFGDDKNAEEKLKRLDIFYFDVLKKIGWNYYKVINIMYKDQVVCLK